MPTLLRIIAWNIAEGSMTGELPANSTLPRIAEQIRSLSPDIVLLNEVKNWKGWPFGSGVNQVKEIAKMTGLPYYQWGNTVATFLTGYKAVAVLSRYPVESPRVHPVMQGTSTTTYATIETAIRINYIKHYVFSTRFDAHNLNDNIAGHQQAIGLLHKLDPHAPVIFGGDFNAEPGTSQMIDFVANSGLKDVYLECQDPEICGKRIDYIFYRGPYKVNKMLQRCPWTELTSDHPWIFVELLKIDPPPPLGLDVSVQPHPVPLGTPVQITVWAKDRNAQTLIAGTVQIDKKVVGSTNTPFTYTFIVSESKKRVFDSELKEYVYEYEYLYPSGTVTAPGYPEVDIDFGFR